MDKPEALRLADALEAYWAGANGHDRERQAAAELRRLHAENQRLCAQHANLLLDTRCAKAQRDALLVALKEVMRIYKSASVVVAPMIEMNRAAQQAVKAVEGEKT